MAQLCDRFQSLSLQNYTNNTNTNDQKYAKDSFDRFGDDLARLLLSYHSYDEKWRSFESRARHECVSKQFQRCIYDTITQIRIEWKVMCKMALKECMNKRSVEVFRKVIDFIADKYPNIERIRDFVCMSESIGDTAQVLEAMYALPRLQCVHFHNDFFRPHAYQLLSPFGSMVTNIAITEKICFPYEQHFPQLCSLWTYGLDLMFAIEDNHLLSFNRLKEIRIILKEEEYNAKRFTQFIAYYGSRLTTLNIDIHEISENSETKLTQFLAQVSEFTELKELSIQLSPLYRVFIHYSLYDSLKRIGLKCVKLKKLSLSIRSKNTALIAEIMNSIQFMSQLKRLQLGLSVSEDMATDWSKLEPFNLWPHLTHLNIHCYKFPQELFEQIVSAQQRLHTLILMEMKFMDNKWLKCVSRLSALKSLMVWDYLSHDQSFRESELKSVLNKCQKLIAIYINDEKIDGKYFDPKSVPKSHLFYVIL